MATLLDSFFVALRLDPEGQFGKDAAKANDEQKRFKDHGIFPFNGRF